MFYSQNVHLSSLMCDLLCFESFDLSSINANQSEVLLLDIWRWFKDDMKWDRWSAKVAWNEVSQVKIMSKITVHGSHE